MNYHPWERARRLAAGLLGRSAPVILMYHRVDSVIVDPWGLAVTPDNFRFHMEIVRRTRRPLTLDDLVQRLLDGKLEAGSIAITFDDAYRDVLINAKPALAEFDIPATVFVVTGKIGGTTGFWWDRLVAAVLSGQHPATLPRFSFAEPADLRALEQAFAAGDRDALHLQLWRKIRTLAPAGRDLATDEVAQAFMWSEDDEPQVMSEADLRRLTAGGLITLGAHTASHPSLPTLSPEAQHAEIAESCEWLRTFTGRPVRGFAYPFGDYDAQSLHAVHSLQLDYAVSVEAGAVVDPAVRYRLPRHDIKNWGPREFASRLRWWL